MNPLFFLGLLVFLAMPSPAAPSPAGWDKARFGMSVAEVVRSCPKDKLWILKVPLDNQDGTTTLLALDGVELGGRLFRAWLTFDDRDGTLVKVLLRLVDDRHADPSLYTFVKCRLGDEMGAPTKESAAAAVDSLWAIWEFPETVVTLKCVDKRAYDAKFFSIDYRLRFDKADAWKAAVQ